MELLNKDNEHLLENFAKTTENNSPQFSIQWKNEVEKSYGNCTPNYYLNKIGENVKTIFPFFLVKSKIFGNRLISLPFADFGGPFGEFDEKFLGNVLETLKENEGVSKIEIRLNDFVDEYEKMEKILIKKGFEKEFKKNQCILKLKGEEELWNDFNRITKKGVKKAQKSGLVLKDINNDEELNSFYKLYFKNMKNFGTPQHSYDFFKNLMEIMGEKFKGLNCYKDSKLIGSLIALHTKEYACAAYTASEKKFLVYQPNDLIHWEIIKWCANKGIKYFDFGQCNANSEEGTHERGIFKFKSKWGGEMYNRYYFNYNFDKKDKLESAKEERETLVKIWRKVPSFLIKILGPRIASQLAL
ncbi:MAG: GNAT family N-acetyltransferase [archaeon]